MTVLKKMQFPSVFFIFLFFFIGLNVLRAEDEEKEEHHTNLFQKESQRKINKNTDFPTVLNPKWKAECSSCHMLYLPGLLPSRSWSKMMSSLNKHFGENAELDPATQKEITDFLIQNSSDKIHTRRGDKILSDIGKNEEILRISETTYFKRKHDELGANVYKRKGIKSPANCLACHSGAEKGDFSEDNVRIPKENSVKIK